MRIDIKKIIELRKTNKLTISQMAKYLNKARSTVSCWENNKTLPSKTELSAWSLPSNEEPSKITLLLKQVLVSMTSFMNVQSRNDRLLLKLILSSLGDELMKTLPEKRQFENLIDLDTELLF